MILRPYHIPFILILLLAACSGAQSSEVTLKLQGMQFSQSQIQVQVGQPVTLYIDNKDGFSHAFDLDEFDIHLSLAAEETAEITITPSQSGSFTFYCSSPGHRAAGMEGSFLVTP